MSSPIGMTGLAISLDSTDRDHDWPSYYFLEPGLNSDHDVDPHEWLARMRRSRLYITPDSDSDSDVMYYNNNRPLHTTEKSRETERRRDDDDPGTIIIRPGKYTVGTGKVIPKEFSEPYPLATPEELFPPGLREDTSPPVRRFISRLNCNEMLIYTDGACLGNGQPNPRAGCGVIFREERPGRRGHFAFPLELQGPTGNPCSQTSNRAELRAVIAALQFCNWPCEEWTKVVIATDSEYVVKGATSWVKGWVRNGWRTRNGRPVKNKDLWKCLLGWCEDAATFPAKTKLEFWRIPREWNTEADKWAKLAADKGARSTTFMRPWGNRI